MCGFCCFFDLRYNDRMARRLVWIDACLIYRPGYYFSHVATKLARPFVAVQFVYNLPSTVYRSIYPASYPLTSAQLPHLHRQTQRKNRNQQEKHQQAHHHQLPPATHRPPSQQHLLPPPPPSKPQQTNQDCAKQQRNGKRLPQNMVPKHRIRFRHVKQDIQLRDHHAEQTQSERSALVGQEGSFERWREGGGAVSPLRSGAGAFINPRGWEDLA